jgi:hypothetical protein
MTEPGRKVWISILGNLSPKEDGDSSISKLQASTNTFEPCCLICFSRLQA